MSVISQSEQIVTFQVKDISMLWLLQNKIAFLRIGDTIFIYLFIIYHLLFIIYLFIYYLFIYYLLFIYL